MTPKRVAELLALGHVRLERAGDVAVTNAAGGTRLLQYNAARVQVLVVNNEANAAFLTRRPNPTTTTGIRLDAQGGNYQEDYERAGASLGAEYWAILATGAGNLYVEEYVVYEPEASRP